MKKLKTNINALPLGSKLTIAIDIDGTVADSSLVDLSKVHRRPDEFMKARPIKDAVEAIKKLHKDGHTIVFHSSRDHGSKAITRKWLKKHGFPFHHIEMGKFLAHVYIDDRAINGCSWNQAMRQLQKRNLPGVLARRGGRI
jgi:predicted secreted acid phosphatase